MRWLKLLAFMLAVFAAAPVHATDWHKAETDLFVVYGNVREDALREYAVKLTNFDRVLRIYAPPPKDAPPLRKLDVYLVRGHSDLARIVPRVSEGIQGFYHPGPRAVFAAGVAVPVGITSKDEILFHEYAHHYMLEHFPAPYPTWFVEGWADFFATTKFEDEDYLVGRYDPGRVAVLFSADWLPLSDLLTKTYGQTKNIYQFYSQAWLLTHYMYDDPDRRMQLNQATRAIANGADPAKAMEEATGLTLQQLTGKLRAYRQIRITKFGGKPPGPAPVVTVSEIPDSTGDFLLDRLRLASADTDKPDTGYLRDLRARAKKVPDSESAQLTLASAEYLYGEANDGDAIAGKYLAAHPDDVQALATAGVGNVVAGERLKDRRAELYRRARAYLIKAYASDKDDPSVLFAYATSRTIEQGYPNENDVNVLLAARAMAPSVQEISLMAGAALMQRGNTEAAKPILAAVANNPHADRLAKAARAVMDGKTLEEALADKPKDDKAAGGSAPPKPGA